MSQHWSDASNNLLTPLRRAASKAPDDALVSHRRGNKFFDVSSANLWNRVYRLAKGLIAARIEPGDRVALMGKTSLEWLLVDHAVMAAGGVTVPVYETSSPAQVQWILEDSGARLLVVGTDELAELTTPLAAAAPACNDVVLNIESGGLEALVQMGETVPHERIDARLADIDSGDTATIIYTSGTTGQPKGCVLSHGNLRANVQQISDALRGTVDESDSALLFLPMAHVLTKITALYCLEHRIKIAFGTSIDRLPEELAMTRPSLISAVPRIFEKVYAAAQHRAENDGKGRIFERASDIAIRWSREQVADELRTRTKLEHALYDRLVYSKIRNSLGGNLRMAFSGGGPLGERLASFFDGIGVRIYEGYGLTETSPILTLSRADAWMAGAVGTAVADTELRLADDGEILAKGPQVFSEYWRNPTATAEVFDADGWFRTGDIGQFDDDATLHIVGRLKDLIVTAAGKNVAPAPLEDQLRAHSLISQALVIGDARPFISALITLDADAIDEWRTHHKPDELQGEIQQAVDRVNESVSRAESIRKFEILPHDFELEAGEITPTLKVRRSVVMDRYADLIDKMYAS